MVKKNLFDAYAPPSSRSETKLKKDKEPIPDEKHTLENMYEMMKSLTFYQGHSKD